MKFQSAFVYLLMVLSTAACSKKPVNVPPDGTMSLSIDDTLISFTAQTPATIENLNGKHFLHFSAIDQPDSKRTLHFGLILPHEIAPGTYKLRPGGIDTLVELSLAYETFYPVTYDAGRGNENFITMTISSRTDKRIQGTFQAILTNNKSDSTSITNGVFDYPFVYPRPI